jgi:hypothetical protein
VRTWSGDRICRQKARVRSEAAGLGPAALAGQGGTISGRAHLFPPSLLLDFGIGLIVSRSKFDKLVYEFTFNDFGFLLRRRR